MSRELILKIQKDDENAFSELVNQYNSVMFGYALSLTKDYEQAQDIMQNVFLNVWVKRNKLSPDIEIRSYLFKSVYHNFIDLYRKEKKQSELEKLYHEMLFNYINTISDSYLEKKIFVLKKEILNLPEKSKEIFLLSKQNGLTNEEIADILKISIKTVEYHITRCYKILRHKIGEKIKLLLFICFLDFSTNCSSR